MVSMISFVIGEFIAIFFSFFFFQLFVLLSVCPQLLNVLTGKQTVKTYKVRTSVCFLTVHVQYVVIA